MQGMYKNFKCLLFIFRNLGWIYYFSGHLFAHPDTQAPNTRAEKPGHTSIHACRTSPGQVKELLWAPPLPLDAGECPAPELVFLEPDPWLVFPFLVPPLLLRLLSLALVLRLLLLLFWLFLLLVFAAGEMLFFCPPASAPDPEAMVRFLGAPRGPGQGLQPSWVSLGSPWQVG